MKSSQPIAIIGGYDLIARSFFSKIKALNKKSIFINVHYKKIKKKSVYNYEIFQLKKILDTLKKNEIKKLLFIGKISRPNLSLFKKDGEIDKYIPQLLSSYKEGDGKILSSVINIFAQKGFKIISANKISETFLLNKNELDVKISIVDKIDVSKSVKLLNDLSKYDNAQSIVSINGYIIAIEAAEGTDNLLLRVASIRKSLNQLSTKAGILTKIPKKNQSKLIDLPVIGLKTLKLIKKANLNGIAINPSFTIIHDKSNFLKFANDCGLKIYNIK